MGNDTGAGLACSVCQAHFNFVDKISFNLHIQITESGVERGGRGRARGVELSIVVSLTSHSLRQQRRIETAIAMKMGDAGIVDCCSARFRWL